MTGPRASGTSKDTRSIQRSIDSDREERRKMVARVRALGSTPRNVTAEDLANQINALKRAITGA